MEQSYNLAYKELEAQLDKLIAASSSEIDIWSNETVHNIEKSASDLDAWDYCFSIAIGLLAPHISTNEELQDYLKEIHNAASEANGDYDFLQRMLGILLHHKGDPIDKMGRNFIKRDRENAYIMFHRLLWGHDILSIKDDNPFYLMFKKQGLSGIIQAIQHLLADTTSKQGLPFPGSSFFDFMDENDSLSNYLIKISQQLSINTAGNQRNAQEIYSHMFSVRAADMLGTGYVVSLSELYFSIRAIDDKIKKLQFLLISYSISFWGQAIIGIGRLGVPSINIVDGMAMIRCFTNLLSTCSAQTETLLKEGRLLEIETDKICALARDDLGGMEFCKNESEIIHSLERGKANAQYLMQIWEESGS